MAALFYRVYSITHSLTDSLTAILLLYYFIFSMLSSDADGGVAKKPDEEFIKSLLATMKGWNEVRSF